MKLSAAAWLRLFHFANRNAIFRARIFEPDPEIGGEAPRHMDVISGCIAGLVQQYGGAGEESPGAMTGLEGTRVEIEAAALLQYVARARPGEGQYGARIANVRKRHMLATGCRGGRAKRAKKRVLLPVNYGIAK